MIDRFRNNINEHLDLINQLNNEDFIKKMTNIVRLIIDTYQKNGKVIFAGNGGSFSDCLHLSAELTGRFKLERNPLNSIVLGSNPSSLTAIANDYGYPEVFTRELIAISDPNKDLLMCYTTSGNSENIIKAVHHADKSKLNKFIFCGKSNGQLNKHPNAIKIPSENTARIQEAHLMLGHMIIEEVESLLFKND